MISLEVKNTILIADDSTTVRRILRQILEDFNRNLTIIEASNGEECCRLLQSGTIDIAFVDHYMPGMNGLDAISQLESPSESAFIIAMSSSATMAEVEDARRLGVYEFLKKPFRPEDVKRLLQQHGKISIMQPTLVVDDSKPVRKLVRQVIENSRFNLSVHEARNAETAYELAARFPLNLALIDFHMPGHNGLEVARMIRSLQPQVKIILMTGEATKELVQQARKERLSGFLKKPFFEKELDQILHIVMGMQVPTFDNGPTEEEDLDKDVIMI